MTEKNDGSPNREEEALGAAAPKLLLGIFLHPEGRIEMVAAEGVDPFAMLMNAIGNYVDSLRQDPKQQSPILRAGGPLPPTPPHLQ
jgi:hypothetical protein